MKKIANKSLLFFIVFLLALSNITVSAEEKDIIKEKQYTSFDSSEKTTFEEKITENGKTYKLEDVTYDVLEKEPNTLVEESVPMPAGKEYTPKQEIQKDGVTYVLISVTKKEIKTAKPWTQKVNAYSVFESIEESNKASNTKTVTVKDKITGKKVKVDCKKFNTKKLADIWVDSYIDIVFSEYDTDAFLWNGIEIKKDVKEPLKGYYSELIKSVGGTEESYKVQKVYWVGKSYIKNGIVYRNARADVSKKIPQYRVNYIGEILHKKANVYTCTYQDKNEVENGQKTYLITAKAKYKQTNNIVVAVTITVAVLLVLILVVLILFLILRKKKTNKK